jgi:hypothetical protein
LYPAFSGSPPAYSELSSEYLGLPLAASGLPSALSGLSLAPLGLHPAQPGLISSPSGSNSHVVQFRYIFTIVIDLKIVILILVIGLGVPPDKTSKQGGLIDMAGRPFPTDVVKQAQNVLNAWHQIDARLSIGALTPALLTTDIIAATTLASDIAKLEAQLTDKRNQRDALYTQIWDRVKRVRNGVKGIYGDDSSQYEMIGGIRLSERKSPTRKAVKA